MSRFDSDHLVLILSIMFIFLMMIKLNKVETYKDPLIDKLREDLLKVDPRVAELTFQAANESFTEDKKHVYLCLKDKMGKYYDYNMLMYVCLHELAHAFSKSVDENHTSDEFKNNFKVLLKRAEELRLYDPTIPLIYDYCNINSTSK